MKKPDENEPFDALSSAYESMQARVAEQWHRVQDRTGDLLHGLIDRAKDESVVSGELTEEESAKVAGWLKRDLHEISSYLSDTGHELSEWLGFETELVEQTLLDRLLQVADKTTLELLRLKALGEPRYSYKTGEITGPGSLVCDGCDEKLTFHKTGRIPPCPRCHGVLFSRPPRSQPK